MGKRGKRHCLFLLGDDGGWGERRGVLFCLFILVHEVLIYNFCMCLFMSMYKLLLVYLCLFLRPCDPWFWRLPYLGIWY